MNITELKFFRERGDGRLLFYCPGCKNMHSIDNSWRILGHPDAPTVIPSILVNKDYDKRLLTAPVDAKISPRCHLEIREGYIFYSHDCTHSLAGQIVKMELP